MEELKRLADLRDEAENRFRTAFVVLRVNIALNEDRQIADNMRDYWKHQQSDAE